MAEPQTVLVFVPSLISTLLRHEQLTGRPLVEQEVLDIRDKAACVALDAASAQAVFDKREYDDIDPKYAWSQWQQARALFAEAEPDASPEGEA